MALLPRTYARLWWQGARPGLMMASAELQFFLYAEPLIAMYNSPGTYKVVKWRHKHPEKAIGCHPGDIYGQYDVISNDIARIKLFFGEGGRSIEIFQNELRHVLRDYLFFMPKEELSDRVRELKRTLLQTDRFTEMKLRSEGSLPIQLSL